MWLETRHNSYVCYFNGMDVTKTNTKRVYRKWKYSNLHNLLNRMVILFRNSCRCSYIECTMWILLWYSIKDRDMLKEKFNFCLEQPHSFLPSSSFSGRINKSSLNKIFFQTLIHETHVSSITQHVNKANLLIQDAALISLYPHCSTGDIHSRTVSNVNV